MYWDDVFVFLSSKKYINESLFSSRLCTLSCISSFFYFHKWQGFDGEEFLKCLRHLVHIEKEWVPYSNKCSLYIRPTLIGTQVSLIERSSFGSHLLTWPAEGGFPPNFGGQPIIS